MIRFLSIITLVIVFAAAANETRLHFRQLHSGTAGNVGDVLLHDGANGYQHISTDSWDKDATNDFSGNALDLFGVPSTWENVVVSDAQGLKIIGAPANGAGAINLKTDGSDRRFRPF